MFVVKISFKSRKLEKQLTVARELKKTYGSMAKKVNQRMKELEAADNLEVFMTIPAARCHKLKGDREGEYAVSISGNYRLIFRPDHDPVPRKGDQSIDAIRVTDIQIMGTEDYH